MPSKVKSLQDLIGYFAKKNQKHFLFAIKSPLCRFYTFEKHGTIRSWEVITRNSFPLK